MTRYQIVEQEGRWVITSTRDPDLIWAGSHWAYADQSGPHLISFSDRDAAEKYGRKVLGDGEKHGGSDGKTLG